MADNFDETAAGSSFWKRLKQLPIVEDSLALYQSAQTYKSVAVVANVADSSIQTASKIFPMTTLLRPVGGWQAINQWACQGLDKVQAWAPIISKPTTEAMGDVKGKLLKVVARDKPAESITDALVIRAEEAVMLLNDYSGGRIAVNFATILVDNANTFVDAFLPPVEGELKELDSAAETLVPKASALALKTSLRIYRTLHTFVHPDASCMDFSTIHLMKFLLSSAKQWYTAALELPSAVTGKFSLILAIHPTERITVYLSYLSNAIRRSSAAEIRTYAHDVAVKLESMLKALVVIIGDWMKTAIENQRVLAEHSPKRVLAASKTESPEMELSPMASVTDITSSNGIKEEQMVV
ncbi:uncharacterized protein [Cherax quadricarinatus]|uniref:uncharacterized protein n=1 Tax=Cherax quadricarinatus TaxID=27406 RepID=UPI00387E73EA